ncbi:uncharacterized protein LOC120189999 [Hibiscus syriacus]|uniref:uncharacterized protein LOC120189999 n=1 Tax=Hibiscus syriacus TaxID=106335 RepID=UPI0019246427|nr:uncharacterized protein LOC120189999 [Hibiscus syriacus]
MVYQEQPRVASASGRNISNKQTFDLLPLSAGGISMEVKNSSNKVGNAIESLSQLQGKVPYLHSFQKQSHVPFSIPATRYTDHRSTAQLHIRFNCSYLNIPVTLFVPLLT